MNEAFGPMLLIVNPRAGRGAVERAVPAIRALLRDAGVEHDLVPTEGRGHACDLARAAILEGRRYLVAVGGDGTTHEVVNGMMGEDGPLDPDLLLGVVPSGTGCDFVRTFGLPQDSVDATRHLLGPNLWGKLDVGRVRYRDPAGGDMTTRWFLNIAEAGIGADVVRSAARMPRWLGGRAYRLAALRGIMQFAPQPAMLAMNARRARGTAVDAPLGPVAHDGSFTMVVVANCQFFGGGLRVAPRAIPSDAMLDVLVGEGSKWDAIKALQRMPKGLHVPSPTITEYLADRVDLDAAEPLWIEADGELLGTTPASFDVLPGAISLKA